MAKWYLILVVGQSWLTSAHFYEFTSWANCNEAAAAVSNYYAYVLGDADAQGQPTVLAKCLPK